MKNQYLKIFQKGQFQETEIDRFLASAKEFILGMEPSWTVKLFAARHYPKRTLPQNSYYWVLIKIIKDALRELGHDVDEKETHYMLRERLLYSELVNEETGEVARIVKSTQKLSTTEFNEYLENVKRFCAEWLKLVLPDPDTQLEINIDRNE